MTSCWIAPGSTKHLAYANGSQAAFTVRRDGTGRLEVANLPARTFTTKLSAGVFVRTYDNETTKPDSWRMDDPPPKTGAYRGYFCR